MINKNWINFNEHGYSVKLEDYNHLGRRVLYGYLHEIELSKDSDLVLRNFRLCVDSKGNTSESVKECPLICSNPYYKQVLTIGNLTVDLRFYMENWVSNFIKEKLGK